LRVARGSAQDTLDLWSIGLIPVDPWFWLNLRSVKILEALTKIMNRQALFTYHRKEPKPGLSNGAKRTQTNSLLVMINADNLLIGPSLVDRLHDQHTPPWPDDTASLSKGAGLKLTGDMMEGLYEQHRIKLILPKLKLLCSTNKISDITSGAILTRRPNQRGILIDPNDRTRKLRHLICYSAASTPHVQDPSSDFRQCLYLPEERTLHIMNHNPLLRPNESPSDPPEVRTWSQSISALWGELSAILRICGFRGRTFVIA